MDIPLWDESNSVGAGVLWKEEGKLPEIAASPLYALFYGLLLYWLTPISAVYAMKFILSLFVISFLFIFLRQTRISALVITFLCIIWLASVANIPEEIMVNHFVLLVLLIALIFFSIKPIISFLIILLGIFIRLELILAIISLVLVDIILILKSKRPYFLKRESLPSKIWEKILFTFLVIFTGWLIYMVPLNLSTNRMWLAFQQHYALSQVEKGETNINPWTDFNIITSSVFKDANSIIEAIFANPNAFIEFEVRNLLIKFPKAVANLLLPPVTFKLKILILVFATFIFISLFFLTDKKEKIQFIKQKIRQKNMTLYLATFCGIPAVIPALIIFPKPRYFLPCLPLILLIAGFVFSSLLSASHSLNILRLKRLCLLLLMAIYLFSLRPMLLQKEIHQHNLNKVLKMSEIIPKGNIVFLGVASSSFANYLGKERIIPIEPISTVGGGKISQKITIQSLINIYHPDVLLISAWLINSQNFDKASLNDLTNLDDSWRRYDLEEDLIFVKIKN